MMILFLLGGMVSVRASTFATPFSPSLCHPIDTTHLSMAESTVHICNPRNQEVCATQMVAYADKSMNNIVQQRESRSTRSNKANHKG
eukprot:2738212-Amphidinium_carterae.1